MKYFNIVLEVLIVVAFVWFACKLIDNIKPQKIKDSVVTINVTAEQKAANGRSVRITQKAFEAALRQTAYLARQEAQQEYDRNFAILLSLLTIFGIAWPLIVAFVQYKFNERELDKIQVAEKNASDALVNAIDASNTANNASNHATEASNNANKASIEASQASTAASNAVAGAKKAREENDQILEIIKGFFETFQKASKVSWKMQSQIYKHLEFMVNQAKIGNVSLYNLLKFMSLECFIVGVQLGDTDEVNATDVEKIYKSISSISLENTVSESSKTNQKIACVIRTEIEQLSKLKKTPEADEYLTKILEQINDICDQYNELLPNVSEQ